MEVGAAGDYQKGLRYLSVGRRLNVAARQLDAGDANALRKQADIISAKGLAFLKSAVKPTRGGGGTPPAAMPPL
jgi:hypothetical protein